jgi:hypothetical protein
VGDNKIKHLRESRYLSAVARLWQVTKSKEKVIERSRE